MSVTRRTVLQGAGGGAIALAISRFSSFSAAAQDATPAASPAAGPYPVMAYTAIEYSFTGPGSFASGLNEVSLTNNGTMTHHGMFILLNENKTISDLEDAAAKSGLGGVFSVGTSVGGPASIDPGLTSTVIVDFPAGNYALICVIPDANGVPHLAHGMALPITITEATGAAAPTPTADLSIELAEYMFTDLPATVKAGPQIWSVKNVGAQLHELAIFKLAPGFTLEMLIAIVGAPAPATPMAGMDMSTPAAAASPAAAGAPPFVDVAGFAPVSPGKGGWAVLDLEAANYAALCFVPDVKSGKPHFALGMAMAFTAS